ncbi:DUF805 domain-containing protein [Macrococcus capreoli]|uniref:DUF805 domain-containing protein n=1 Tax=Macrococcus capreoli TaxID=2982690 RepID=UPI0021D5CED1|nr:DUF805 domain-containing protein [Macrococcus sp. TMW 2.2395]MCU7558444.1 DUF805 domain-containing protein [Macrococcus sp. TMW 2.2395]
MNTQQNEIIHYYKLFWTRALDINGRSSRQEFWHPYWINFVISALLGILSAGTLSALFALAIIVPSFTVTVRRLHDTNRTMLLAVISQISSTIAVIASVVFVLSILAAASAQNTTFLGASLIAGLFGTAVVGIIYIYTIFVLAQPGNKYPNNYGDGGSSIKD